MQRGVRKTELTINALTDKHHIDLNNLASLKIREYNN